MIDRLIAGLGEAASALTAEELAEALWLAGHMPVPTDFSPDDTGSSTPVAMPEPPAGPTSGNLARPAEDAPIGGGATARTGAGAAGRAHLYLATTDGRQGEALWAGSPAVSALPHALALGRALGGLRRAVDSPRQVEFDEDRTADLMAETRIPQVVFRSGRDRWLNLDLVVDTSPSMVIWESTVQELVALARRITAFGAVRVWRVHPDVTETTPVLSTGTTETRRSPGELIDATGRRLILIFSDCIAPMWAGPEILRWLESWGRSGPVAVLQPLPQRLWHRCRTPTHLVTLHPPGPAAPMARMRPTLRDEGTPVPADAVAIPVLELTAPWLESGVAMITGRVARLPAVALLTRQPDDLLDDADLLNDDPPPSDPDQTPAIDLVHTFRAGASTNARHLAEFLAAAPLTLPVMRLVQRLMLPDSLPRDLAEVFLSDLLYRKTPLDPPVPADRVLYDFRTDVRQILLTGLRAGEALTVLDEVSHFVNQHMGTSFDFPALLAGQQRGIPTDELGQPFAEVAREVLTALGGRYAALADGLLPAATTPGAGPAGFTNDDPPSRRPDRRRKGDQMTPTHDRGPAVPDTDHRPAVWGGDIPPRNPDFTGREELLQQLRGQLTSQVRAALLPHTLHGLGGVGKTQLAVEYAYRYDHAYDLVWWVPAEQPTLIRQSLNALAVRLDLVAPDDVDVGRALTRVYDALRTGRPYRRWLLIFDNANRPEDLSPFLSIPGGHLLITSRNYSWAGIAQTLEVDVFSRAESKKLLRSRLDGLTEPDADRLAQLLGDLPLALEQAVSWINGTATPVAEYAELLEKRTVEALREGTPGVYGVPVSAVFGLALDQLAEQNEPALQLLELCAFFGAEPISIRLLPMGRYANNLPEALNETVRDDIALRRAVRDIGRLGLARVNPTRNSIQVHRLVQAVLRNRLAPGQQAGYRRSVQEILAAYNPGDPTDDPKTWDRHAEIGPHVATSQAVESDATEIRDVVLDQIRYLYVTGDYVSSRELGHTAYQTWTRKLGAEHRLTIVTARFLANAMRSTGELAATRELNEKMLDVARRSLGEDHEHTLALANSLGADLRLSGDWHRSRTLDEDLLVRHRRVFGEDDPNTLRVANNLAIDLRLLGDFRAAYQLDLETWNRRRRVLGDDHPATVHGVLGGLSRDLYGLARYYEAIDLQQRWLPVLRERLGSDHSNVLLASRVHAATLREAGRSHEALDLARDVAERRRERYGSDHNETMSAMLTLFTMLAQTNRLAEARLIGEETLAGYRRLVGEQHSFTYVAMTDLAIVLRMAGDYQRARDLDEAALHGMMTATALGPEHPYTICTTVNMSNNLALAREYDASVALLSETWDRARRVQGPEHPEALAIAANLALDLQATGQVEAARQLREEALRGLRRTLREGHPDIDDLVQGRRLYCVVDPPPT
ncbi:FxSxx-COOH system tetratricopeptide repeat protein [Micromonospora sp. NPDC049903]|uniref:FxSxx-COOH system tetratricopeptide repeat protein n=1 Tax=Micromonospora sp. NPDC049903 TaxID=3364276 RepID=UPI0037951B9C